MPVSQGLAEFSWNSAERITGTFLPTSGIKSCPRVSWVVWRVRCMGEVIMRSIWEKRGCLSSTAESSLHWLIPRGVRGGSGIE